jgi:hypothetical protein
MDVKATLLAMATAGLLSLIAACGGSADDGGSASTTNGSSGSASAASGSNDSSVHTGDVMGPCGSTATITVRWDYPDWFAYDAPMVFLAQPGPVTATLLAAPAHDSSWGSFTTEYHFSQDTGYLSWRLGITSDDSVGKSVQTVSIPGQPPGVPIIFSAYVTSVRTAMGALVSTGWLYGSGFSCCDGIERVRAQVSFGANNTAIVSFGGAPDSLPDSWSTTPLQIQLTNVTSVSGCKSEARKDTS